MSIVREIFLLKVVWQLKVNGHQKNFLNGFI